MSLQRNLTLVNFLILANLFAFVRGQSRCNSDTYTNHSTYQTNLNTLLPTLSTNIDDNGFYNASVGRVNALALCRGDTQLDFCRSCVRNATNELIVSCPDNREAVMWYEFCMVRYSDSPLYGMVNIDIDVIWWNPNNSMTPWISADIVTLVDNLRRQASMGGSLRKVAAGNTDSIYALLQCTPDLSREDCDYCLNVTIRTMPSYFRGRVPMGARILTRSCFLRYEINAPFYNETRLKDLANVPSPVPVPVPVPMPRPPTPSQPPGNDYPRNHNKTRIITIIIIVSVVGGLIVAISFGFLIRKMNQKPKEESENDEIEDVSTAASLQYDFGVIKAATNDFSEANKLGQGGFGVVYRGILANGQAIAVKRLSKGSGQGNLEFKNEVVLLAELQHRNLVRLFGFSLQKPEKLLVYEFVPNASLDHFLFDSSKRLHLDWDTRYKIIGGITRGILYLHEDSRLRIIHRDLKASNILLDGDMNPKIADFGMARLFVPDETHASTSRIVGTYGYMAPEYLTRGKFSIKSDVFSFGVLVLEIVSGQKNKYVKTDKDLLSNVWEEWQKGTVGNIVDPILRPAAVLYIPQDILRCIHIGLICVQENAAERPTMASVVRMLNSFSISLPVPSPPAFYDRHNGDHSESLHSFKESNSRGTSLNRFKKNDGAESSDMMSQNETSISEFHAR